MKSILMSVAILMLVALAACKEKKGKLEITKDGVTIEGKKGGSAEVNKEGVRIEGKDGGKVEVDKEGVKVEGADKKK